MKNFKEINRAPAAEKQELNSANKEQETDWKEVLVDIILKILTLGFYHLERHRSNNGTPK